MIDYLNIYNLEKVTEVVFIYMGALLLIFFILALFGLKGAKSFKEIFPFISCFVFSIIVFFSLKNFFVMDYKKELKKSKVENVELFEKNVESLIKISDDKKYINKILNDFYNNKENSKNIENKVELKK